MPVFYMYIFHNWFHDFETFAFPCKEDNDKMSTGSIDFLMQYFYWQRDTLSIITPGDTKKLDLL